MAWLFLNLFKTGTQIRFCSSHYRRWDPGSLKHTTNILQLLGGTLQKKVATHFGSRPMVKETRTKSEMYG